MKYIVIFCMVFFSSSALATKCWTQSQNELVANNIGKDAFEFAVERASVIFVAKAQSVQKTLYERENEEPLVLNIEAKFEIVESIKGNVFGEVVTESDDICACKYQFKPGITYLVLAGKYKDSLQVYSCEYIKPAEKSRAVDARRIVGVNKARQ
ncbi:hypothetical protein [Microbulbifer sp. TYP-18]|uniref:hypothetical protein n=1 Tax=Microbulbifer sp. TYP-18 TaxID=3230024 RepID=UPI0034C69911